MGVIIAQSRSTAHVVRLFGALIVFLLVMGLALGAIRMRGGNSGAASPYGGLTAVAPAPLVTAAEVPGASSVIAPIVQAASPPQPAPADLSVTTPVAAVPAKPPSPAAVVPDTTLAPQARVIPLTKTAPDAAPLPAPQSSRRAAAPVPPTDTVEPRPSPPTRAIAQTTAGGGVNINTASVDTLNHLPGAGRIGRTIVRHRPYTSIKDLLDHRVLRASEYARIKPLLTAE